MSAVLFLDTASQQPYDTDTLGERALGGSEATLVRVADALGAWVMQGARQSAHGRYLPVQALAGIRHVIVNREPSALELARTLFPQARAYLWVHDRLRPGGKRARGWAASAALLRERLAGVVCVSDWQRAGVAATLAGLGVSARALTIYNPIDERLAPDSTATDERKLVFFSSPNKGLDFTLDAFAALRRLLPDQRLVIANPGYRRAAAPAAPGVQYLGALPQARVHAEVRSALCTFFPNFTIPETFGLVFAESHALGTPVLTLDCGAAREVLGDTQEVLPLPGSYRRYEALAGVLPRALRAPLARLAAQAGLFDALSERVCEWRRGARPQVAADERFRLSAVVPRWRALLQE